MKAEVSRTRLDLRRVYVIHWQINAERQKPNRIHLASGDGSIPGVLRLFVCLATDRVTGLASGDAHVSRDASGRLLPTGHPQHYPAHPANAYRGACFPGFCRTARAKRYFLRTSLLAA